jgi:hypothetical protein
VHTACFPIEYVPAAHVMFVSDVVDGQATPGGQSIHAVCFPVENVPASHSIVFAEAVDGHA